MGKEEQAGMSVESSGETTEESTTARMTELQKANAALQKEIAERRESEIQHQLYESRLETLLELYRMADSPRPKLLKLAIERALTLTASQAGYIASLDNDQPLITVETMTGPFPIPPHAGKPNRFAVDEPGLWNDIIRKRMPLMVNQSKTGEEAPLFLPYPPGEIEIFRHMNIPVFEKKRVALIIGVCNKKSDYEPADLRNLQLLMQVLLEILRRKEAEEKIIFEMKQRKQVEQQMRVLVSNLQNANSELEDFVYALSHDLKAPLRGISSLANWLNEDYGDKLDDEGREYLDKLVSRSIRMNNLIEGILQYSRIGRTEIDPQTLNSETILRQVIGDLTIPPHISVSIATPLPMITYDRAYLLQIFHNLIGNAIKYNDKQEGSITISCKEQNLTYEFCIQDNGIGIEEKHFERIFRIFQGLDKSPGKESTGIGLSLVKKIIERSGGRIWLESASGKGTSFYFTVPKKNLAVKGSSGLTILVIDDNVEFVEIATTILQRQGHRVLTAKSGEEALHSYHDFSGDIHLALMDLHIPHEEPLDRYYHLRQLRPDMKIVACTGSDFSEVLHQLKQEGLNDVLKKPFNMEDLMQVINKENEIQE